MDDLTRAIMIQLNPTPDITPEIQFSAKSYCTKIIQDNRKNISYFFDMMQSSPEIYVKFWTISALEEIVTNYYHEYDIALRQQLHNFYFQILEKFPGAIFCSPYIESKYANLFCLILRQDYPDYWADAFAKLFQLLQSELCASTPSLKIQYIGYILTTLVAFDREIVDFHDTNSDISQKAAKSELREKSTKIKDQMRINVVNDIAFLLQQVFESYVFFRDSGAENIVGLALEVLEKTVDWAKVELFVVNLPIIVQFLGVHGLQVNAAKSLYAIIDKGMDPSIKMSLFESLNLIGILAQWDPRISGVDEDFQKNMAIVVNKIGLIFLEYLTDQKVDIKVKQTVDMKFPAIIEMSIKYLDQDYPSVSIIISEFLNQYLVLLKKIELAPFHMQSVQMLLDVVVKRIQIPQEYFKSTTLPVYEEAHSQLRNELTTIFVNMCSINSVQNGMIEYVKGMLETLKTSYQTLTLQQREVVLYLFYRIGQSIKDISAVFKPTDPIGNILIKMFEILIEIAPGIFNDHVIILCSALEAVVRYSVYFETHEDACSNILSFFFSDKYFFIWFHNNKKRYKICINKCSIKNMRGIFQIL